MAARLPTVAVPALVLWGESDRVADIDYGHAWADLLPSGNFQLLPAAGHLPQLETPQQVIDAITDFASAERP